MLRRVTVSHVDHSRRHLCWSSYCCYSEFHLPVESKCCKANQNLCVILLCLVGRDLTIYCCLVRCVNSTRRGQIFAIIFYYLLHSANTLPYKIFSRVVTLLCEIISENYETF